MTTPPPPAPGVITPKEGDERMKGILTVVLMFTCLFALTIGLAAIASSPPAIAAGDMGYLAYAAGCVLIACLAAALLVNLHRIF